MKIWKWLTAFISYVSAMHAVDSEYLQFRFPQYNWIEASQYAPGEFASVRGFADYIGPAYFENSPLKNQSLSYFQTDAYLGQGFVFNEYEAAIFELGYSWTHLGWKENPYFLQDDFHFVNLLFNGSTSRIEDWYWRVNASLNFDRNSFNLTENSLYGLTLWGRYDLCDSILPGFGLNIGFVGRTGIDQTLLCPILGIDFELRDNIKLNLVYPVDISAIYTINENWSLALAGKFWDFRHRITKNDNLPRGIVDYKNKGAEFAINYDCTENFTANVHVGTTFKNADIKITDKYDREVADNKFKGVGYLGGGLSFKF